LRDQCELLWKIAQQSPCANDVGKVTMSTSEHDASTGQRVAEQQEARRYGE
jgi:hypothetical protein